MKRSHRAIAIQSDMRRFWKSDCLLWDPIIGRALHTISQEIFYVKRPHLFENEKEPSLQVHNATEGCRHSGRMFEARKLLKFCCLITLLSSN